MDERDIDPFHPNTGYGTAALVALAVTALCAYLAWVHNLLYETDRLRFYWAYWVTFVMCLVSLAGALLVALLTHMQILVVLTLLRVKRHGVESLDTHTTISINNKNKTSNED